MRFIEAATASLTIGEPVTIERQWRLGQGGPSDRTDTKVISSVGPTGLGTRAIIRCPNSGRQLPELVVGEICVHGPSQSMGYWREPEKSKSLHAEVLDAVSGQPMQELYLLSGDLGFLCEGELYICGRSKDTIILRGKNYYPQDIENAAESFCGSELRPGCSAAAAVEVRAKQGGVVEETAILAAELRDPKQNRGSLRELAASIRAAVMARTSVRLHAVSFLRPRTIDKTTSGKLQRHMVRSSELSSDLVKVFHC